MSRRRPGRLAVPLFFLVAAVFTGIHAGADASRAIAHPSTHHWLGATYDLLRTGVVVAFALFTIGRAAPREPARNPGALIVCAAAMIAVVAFAGPGPGVPSGLVIAGELLAVAFCVWLLVSVSFLGRCFGVLPEARGLVTSGPYRLVRHPVYLGELGACAGLALAAPSAANGLVMCGFVVAQWVRMGMEERALRAAFPEYAAYARRTPRLFPAVVHVLPGARAVKPGRRYSTV
ncbi:MAG TPA: methyltransferase [Solirubrobacteraceae bacterium]|nr:methyltransferase [Solirubrobacteraceae bacterium]